MCRVYARTALLDFTARGLTPGTAHLGGRYFLIDAFGRNESLLFQLARALGFLLSQVSLHTGLLRLRLCRAELLMRQLRLRLQIVVPQLQQYLIGLDALTLF